MGFQSIWPGNKLFKFLSRIWDMELYLIFKIVTKMGRGISHGTWPYIGFVSPKVGQKPLGVDSGRSFGII